MKLVVTIPAFNEEKTLAKVIREIPRRINGIKEIKVVVVDDGSVDSTASIAEECGAILVRNKENAGLAYSFMAGMSKALELGADIIVNTDADFQYNQAQIADLAKPILQGKCDIVLGSRFMGSIEYMPLQKRLGNMIVSWLISIITGLKLTDSQTGFRAFSREAALRISVFSDYTYTQETVLEAHEKNLAIKEVPVDFRKREGASRLISNIFVYAKRVGFTIVESYISYKPMKVIFTLGAVSFVAGAAFGIRVLEHFIRFGEVSPYLPTALLSVLLLIIGFQVMLLGLMAELIRRNRKIQEDALYLEKKLAFSKRA